MPCRKPRNDTFDCYKQVRLFAVPAFSVRYWKYANRKGMIALKKYLEKSFMEDNMMGPNAIKLLQQLTSHLVLEPSMRVLDLGCGRGITSLYLADMYDVDVFATDLWIGRYGQLYKISGDETGS